MIHWEKMVISAHKKKNDYDPNVGKILNINQKKKVCSLDKLRQPRGNTLSLTAGLLSSCIRHVGRGCSTLIRSQRKSLFALLPSPHLPCSLSCCPTVSRSGALQLNDAFGQVNYCTAKSLLKLNSTMMCYARERNNTPCKLHIDHVSLEF